MAFTTRATGDKVQATDVTDIHDALTGVSGQGVTFSFTQTNDSAAYALDVRQLDLTNGYIFRARDGSSNTLFSVIGPTSNEAGSVTIARKLVMTGLPSFTSAANMLDIAATWNGGAQAFEAIKVAITNTASAAASYLLDLKAGAAGATNVFLVTPAGNVSINDVASARTTQAVTIAQGGNDDEILALQSSDVVHGMTDLADTDTFGTFKKRVAASGGLAVSGWTEATEGLYLGGNGATDNIAKTTAASAYVYIEANKKSAATTAAPDTVDTNLVVIAAATTTRFIFDLEGSGHADVAWTTYGRYDDLALVANIESELIAREDAVQTERRHYLEQAGIIGKDSWHFEGGRQRAMVNFTKLAMLHHGSIMALGQAMYAVCDELGITESVKARLGGQNVGMIPLPEGAN